MYVYVYTIEIWSLFCLEKFFSLKWSWDKYFSISKFCLAFIAKAKASVQWFCYRLTLQIVRSEGSADTSCDTAAIFLDMLAAIWWRCCIMIFTTEYAKVIRMSKGFKWLVNEKELGT